MSDTFKPFWPKDAQKNEQTGLSDTPKRIDLGKPDAAAAELSETLQTVATNSLFTRLILWGSRSASFVLVWIVRPFIWLPLKALFYAMVWANTPNEKSRNFQKFLEKQAEIQRRDEDNRRYN